MRVGWHRYIAEELKVRNSFFKSDRWLPCQIDMPTAGGKGRCDNSQIMLHPVSRHKAADRHSDAALAIVAQDLHK